MTTTYQTETAEILPVLLKPILSVNIMTHQIAQLEMTVLLNSMSNVRTGI